MSQFGHDVDCVWNVKTSNVQEYKASNELFIDYGIKKVSIISLILNIELEGSIKKRGIL